MITSKTIAFPFILLSLVLPALGQNSVRVNWLGDYRPRSATPVSFGLPWQIGTQSPDRQFAIFDSAGNQIPAASWPMAYWPDGSLKWTAIAATVSQTNKPPYHVRPINPEESTPLARHHQDKIIIDTGQAVYTIEKTGPHLIGDIKIGDTRIAGNLGLAAVTQNSPDPLAAELTRTSYTAVFENVVLEQNTAARAVIKAQGTFEAGSGQKQLFPFVLRLNFHKDAHMVKSAFSFIYDGDQHKDFIIALGMTLDVPLREDVLNRHIKFAGSDGGIWHEAARLFTGRDSLFPSAQPYYHDQLRAKRIPDPNHYDQNLQSFINDLPVWNEFLLTQLSPDYFEVAKRTGSHSSWLKSDQGRRSDGLMFAGDLSGGAAMGMADFWQTYPSAMQISNMAGDTAKMTLWLWPAQAQAMDLRHYSDRGHGLRSFYEDYQPGFSTAHGIARTFQINLWALKTTPSQQRFNIMAEKNARQPLLVCSPQYYHKTQVFGKWSLPDKSTPARSRIEQKLETAINFYLDEIEQRRWYGFWDYGDVMHTYDRARHNWKYDIGGFAWQNTELMTDLWFWYSFLRTGREDIFTMAQAMTRHTQQVDVYHLGPFKGLGSRHNVSHWGCGAKEVRISQALLKRFHYYLTTDQRTADLIDAVTNVDHQLVSINPLRQLLPPDEHPTHIRIGPDWTSLVSNWFTAWERTADNTYRDYIIKGMQSIAEMPHGVFTGQFFGYDPNTKKLTPLDTDFHSPSHMIALFGGAETMMEVNELIDHQPWNQTWLEFCRRYSWPAHKWQTRADLPGTPGSFPVWNSKLTAYAAYLKDDPEIAARAWDEFLNAEHRGVKNVLPRKPVLVQNAQILNPVMEIPGNETKETNHYSQWSLNAIINLELIGDYLPEDALLIESE